MRALARTSDGGAVIAGDFDGPLDLGAGLLATSVKANLFVAKLDCAGHMQWSKSFPVTPDHGVQHGSYGDPLPLAIVERPDGVIVLGGMLFGAFDSLTGTINQRGPAGFLLALDPNGDKLWARSYETKKGQVGVTSLAMGSSGELFATGIGNAGRDFGDATADGDPDAFHGYLAKLDDQGLVVWNKKLSDGGRSRFHARVSTKGSLFVCGSADAPPDFGNGALAEGQLLACAELDAQGSPRWTKGFPAKDAGFRDFALQGERLRLVGLGANVDLGSVVVVGTTHPQAFQVELEAPGTVLRASSFGGSAVVDALRIAVDTDGNATAAFTIEGGFLGVPGGEIDAGTPSSFLVRLDATTPSSVKPTRLGDAMHVGGLSEADVGFLAAGYHSGPLASGGDSLPATPNGGLFVEHVLP